MSAEHDNVILGAGGGVAEDVVSVVEGQAHVGVQLHDGVANLQQDLSSQVANERIKELKNEGNNERKKWNLPD